MQTLKMDFQSQSTPPVVPVMQSDAQSRFIGITLYNGGIPYEAPEDASYTVQYRGPGANNMGWYDTIQLSSGTRKAVIVDSASKNVVTLELAEQALRVNGNVFVNLCVVTNTGYMLKTFPILCRVTGAAFPDTVAVQSFFYVTGITSEQWLAYVTACQDAQKRAEDAAAKFVTDPTLSLSGKAADAAKVGEAVNAEAERAKGVENQLKEDLSYFKDTSGYVLKPLYKDHKESVPSVTFWGLGKVVANHRYALVYTPLFGTAASIGVMDASSKLHDVIDGQVYLTTITASVDGNIMLISHTDINNPVDIFVYDTTEDDAIQDFIKKSLLLVAELKFNCNEQQKVTIKSSDDEALNVVKLTGACNVGNIDVCFEDATYDFSGWYNYVYYMNGNNAFRCEIPIGNGCNYYFNGATINGVVKDNLLASSAIKTNCALFGSRTNEGDYKLINGVINAIGTIYAVHDEMSGKSKYNHGYENMVINYISGTQEEAIRKCIGGGAGRYGNVVLKNCVLNSDYSHELSFHGYDNVLGDVDGKITLNISDCYFGHGIQVDTLPNKEIGTVITVCNSFRSDYADYENKNWTKYSWNNESRVN